MLILCFYGFEVIVSECFFVVMYNVGIVIGEILCVGYGFVNFGEVVYVVRGYVV